MQSLKAVQGSLVSDNSVRTWSTVESMELSNYYFRDLVSSANGYLRSTSILKRLYMLTFMYLLN